MDPIDFENVTLREAKEALDRRDNGGKSGKSDKEKSEWDTKRKPPVQEDLQLLEATKKWIDSLPEKIKPRNLVRQFPRVANRLAKVWPQAAARERELDELLIDNRGDRRGFPIQVAGEIMALKVHSSADPADNSLDWSQSVEGRVR